MRVRVLTSSAVWDPVGDGSAGAINAKVSFPVPGADSDPALMGLAGVLDASERGCEP